MKTVGIIGGFGPETTSEFYLEIIFSCYQKNKKSRPPILIWNVPLEYKIEEDLITKAIGEERYIPYLVEAAKRLESGGADFLVMPCNSLHIFIEDIRKSVQIPVLSIVEETMSFLKRKKIYEVGVVATQSILKHKLYDVDLSRNQIRYITPNESDQQEIGKLINNLVLKRYDDVDRKKLLQIINNLTKKRVSTIILACTDLQLLTPKIEGVQIFDTMKILADATVNKLLE